MRRLFLRLAVGLCLLAGASQIAHAVCPVPNDYPFTANCPLAAARLNAIIALLYTGIGGAIQRPGRDAASGATGTTDTATTADNHIYWRSADTSAKAQAIYGCTTGSTIDKKPLVIVDEIKTAGTYNITITPASGTIDGDSSLVLQSDGISVSLRCHGATTNWVIE